MSKKVSKHPDIEKLNNMRKELLELKARYINDTNKEQTLSIVFKTTIRQLERNIEKLTQIIREIDKEYNLKDTHFIRLGDLIEQLEAYKVIFDLDCVFQSIKIKFDEGSCEIKIPCKINEISSIEYIRRISIGEKDFLPEKVSKISNIEDLKELIIKTEWIETLDDSFILACICNCIAQDKLNGINHRTKFLEQYKTSTNSKIIRIKYADLESGYEKAYFKKFPQPKDPYISDESSCLMFDYCLIPLDDKHINNGCGCIIISADAYSSGEMKYHFLGHIRVFHSSKLIDGSTIAESAKKIKECFPNCQRDDILDAIAPDVIVEVDLDGLNMQDQIFRHVIKNCIRYNKVIGYENTNENELKGI